MQCHVLGVTMLPIVAALFVADLRRRSPGPERRTVWRFGWAGLAIIAASFLPLVIHELTTDFSEVHAAIDYLGSGGEAPALGPLVRVLVIGARVLSWPLTGLLIDAGWVALLAAAAVIAITVWLGRSGTLPEREAARWLGLGLLWTAFALAFLSPSLATIVPGLPNDHYHAFADPMVFTLVGIGAGALWRFGGAPGSGAGVTARLVAMRRVVVVAGVVAVLGWNLAHESPAIHPDGGFPAAQTAAARILSVAGGRPIALRSLPAFKTAEAYAYPLVLAGAAVGVDGGSGPPQANGTTVVVVCDSLFEVVMGARCGGPAEAGVAPPAVFGDPIDRFIAAPGRTISVYRSGP